MDNENIKSNTNDNEELIVDNQNDSEVIDVSNALELVDEYQIQVIEHLDNLITLDVVLCILLSLFIGITIISKCFERIKQV